MKRPEAQASAQNISETFLISIMGGGIVRHFLSRLLDIWGTKNSGLYTTQMPEKQAGGKGGPGQSHKEYCGIMSY